jgi:hypothetical protein
MADPAVDALPADNTDAPPADNADAPPADNTDAPPADQPEVKADEGTTGYLQDVRFKGVIDYPLLPPNDKNAAVFRSYTKNTYRASSRQTVSFGPGWLSIRR